MHPSLRASAQWVACGISKAELLHLIKQQALELGIKSPKAFKGVSTSKKSISLSEMT